MWLIGIVRRIFGDIYWALRTNPIAQRSYRLRADARATRAAKTWERMDRAIDGLRHGRVGEQEYSAAERLWFAQCFFDPPPRPPAQRALFWQRSTWRTWLARCLEQRELRRIHREATAYREKIRKANPGFVFQDEIPWDGPKPVAAVLLNRRGEPTSVAPVKPGAV